MKHNPIFISYKRLDKEKVFKIKDYIESHTGVNCWIDLDGIESDAQFVNVIINAIDSCEVMLFMYSQTHLQINDFEHDYTIKELNYAAEEGKKIVFINIDGTKLTKWFRFQYGTKQQVDAQDPTRLDKLVNDLKGWLKIPEKVAPKVVPEKKVQKLVWDKKKKMFVAVEAKDDRKPVVDEVNKIIDNIIMKLSE